MPKRPLMKKKKAIECPHTKEKVWIQILEDPLTKQVIFSTCDEALRCNFGKCKYKPID